MDLGKLILDKEILDRQGHRVGKVDDLLLELADPAPNAPASPPPEPEVVAIITGPLALGAHLSPPLRRLARLWYRLLGLADPHPITLPWSAVTSIDVTVHLAIDRDEAGALALEQAVERRFIGRLPGA